MPVGTATIDFSGSPTETSITVTGQTSIISGSRVEAWLRLEATENHSFDEVLYENLKIIAGNIIPGSGFTIYARPENGPAHGKFNIDWVWL